MTRPDVSTLISIIGASVGVISLLYSVVSAFKFRNAERRYVEKLVEARRAEQSYEEKLTVARQQAHLAQNKIDEAQLRAAAAAALVDDANAIVAKLNSALESLPPKDRESVQEGLKQSSERGRYNYIRKLLGLVSKKSS